MAFFSNSASGDPSLYLGETLSVDIGWCAYVLPAGQKKDSGIELDQSFNDIQGAYLFAFAAVDVPGDQLVIAVNKYLNQFISPNRAVLWITDFSDPKNIQFTSLGFSTSPVRTGPTGKVYSVTNTLTGMPSSTLKFQVSNNCEISLDPVLLALRIDGETASGGMITFNTVDGIAKTRIEPNRMQVCFSGAGRGCNQFPLSIRQGTDFDILDFGLKYFIPDEKSGQVVQRYPLFRPDEPTQSKQVGFNVWIDLTNLENTTNLRTFFAYTGVNDDSSKTILPSSFLTELGQQINLIPFVNFASTTALPGAGSALMVFEHNPVQGKNRYLAPQGNFTLTRVDAAASGHLICGLNGTETVSFGGDDMLGFVPRQPAFASRFPFTQASPVGPPVNPKAALLDPDYKTSWASIVKGPLSPTDPMYVAQPQGSSLYGRNDGDINENFPTLLGHKVPAFLLPQSDAFAFPLLPYSCVIIANDGTTFTAGQVESFEQQVAGPTRRSVIGAYKPKMHASAKHTLRHVPAENPAENITTPAGVIATIEPAGEGVTWKSILLGQIESEALQLFGFDSPSAELIQAFQTGQLFMVAANGCHFGVPDSTGKAPPACPDGASSGVFHNKLEIGGWKLAAEIGLNNKYGDYRDVFIFKGRPGKLYDPPGAVHRTDPLPADTVSLVANSDKWTQRADFSSPTTTSMGNDGKPVVHPPDDAQQVILSQWLQDYFADVRVRAADPLQNRYFQKLDEIARNDSWTGILVLKMTIEAPPSDLAGITAGITDMSAFNVHHLGIEISQVTPAAGGHPIGLSGSSAMFGLIYYVDPAFVLPAPDKAAVPIAPANDNDYSFRVLSLQVLFDKTAILDFHSYAQITMNKLFEMPVSHMGDGGNTYNTIVLRGSYQNNGGLPVYNLSSDSDASFYFDSNIINKIEITTSQMSTRDNDADGNVLSWFDLSGFIDFSIVQAPPQKGSEDPTPFDIFSFGNVKGEDQLRKGLSFSALGLQMSFPADDPANSHLAFITDEIRFDIGSSTPRDGSLFINFPLELLGLQAGDKDASPGSGNALTVITDARLSGVKGGPWFGLRYRLNMGSPGDLAGKVGLNAYLNTAWSPASSGTSSYKALVGLELPGTGGGASLISLQNVLKLSIGQLRLTRDVAKNSFLFMFTEIALKAFGMLKIPPNGSTLFYLFGDPKSDGKPSGLGWYAMYKKEKATELLSIKEVR